MDKGYRGYIGSRPVRGVAYPQRVQNLVVRDYAHRRGLRYLLSVVEYAMPDSYMMLTDALGALPQLGGLIFFSAFLLPPQPERRAEIYRRFFRSGTALHAALENMTVCGPDDVGRFEAMLEVAGILGSTPFGGRYEKTATPLRASSPIERAILAAAEDPA